MTVDQAVELTRTAVLLGLLVGAPIMLIAAVVGLLISILQAVTQLQDQTLSFVPKIIAMALTALVFFPWIVQRLVEYSAGIFRDIPSLL